MASMPKIYLQVLTAVLLITRAVYAQESLGDIARENRAKQNIDSSAATSKVITNKDLQHDPDADTTSPQPQQVPAPVEKGKGAAQYEARQHQAGQRAEQWRRQILTQKNHMANLQSRIDMLNASIRAENGSAQFSGPNGRTQARQMQQVVNLQQQLDVQRIRLDQMQESARRAGMQPVVYDP